MTEICAVLRPDGSDHRFQEIKGLANWQIEWLDLARQGLSDFPGAYKPKAVLHLTFDASGFLAQSEDTWRGPAPQPAERNVSCVVRSPARRIVHTGSAWVLAAGDRLSEAAWLAPKRGYARAKAKLDEAFPGLGEQTGVNWINLRLFNVFGRYESETRLLPHLVKCLRKGAPAQLLHGDQIRDFKDVDDVAGAYLHALLAPDAASNSLYQVGSGVRTSVREFAAEVAREIGGESLISCDAAATRDRGIACPVTDLTRVVTTLVSRPSADLQQRITRALHWWLRRPVDQPFAVSS